MKPCPYRKTHEYDHEGLCQHCYAERPAVTAEVPLDSKVFLDGIELVPVDPSIPITWPGLKITWLPKS